MIQQKIEFLEMELEEVRRREDNLKKINNSLMQAINNEPTILKDQTLAELQKANEQYLSELNMLKKRNKEQTTYLEKQVQELFLMKKELQIDLKHQKTAAESEKYELLGALKQLESEKQFLEQSLRKREESRMEEVLIEKNTKERQDSMRQRYSLDKSVGESRLVHNKENEQLRGKLEVFMNKLKNKKEKIKRLKEKTNEKSLRMRIEELEDEIETYKMICKKQTPAQYRYSDSERNLKRELDEALSTIDTYKRQSNDKSTSDFKALVNKKDMEIRELKEKLSLSNLEIERAGVDFNKCNLKLQQNEIYWAMSDEKRSETELALKNEIKFLIGKLLKAKSRHGTDNDTKEIPGKSGMITTVRSKSVRKSAAPKKIISPLDLSAITRSDSPFCISHIDL